MKKRRYSLDDRDYMEDEYFVDTRKSKDKRKERRFDRALRTRDISALTEEEGLDPMDVEDDIWTNEIIEGTDDANLQVHK
jgi:hypothetical protein